MTRHRPRNEEDRLLERLRISDSTVSGLAEPIVKWSDVEEVWEELCAEDKCGCEAKAFLVALVKRRSHDMTLLNDERNFYKAEAKQLRSWNGCGYHLAWAGVLALWICLVYAGWIPIP